MKKFIIILCIFLQTAICFAVERNEDAKELEDIAAELGEPFYSWTKRFIESASIIISNDKSIYFHDYTTLGFLTFDESKKVSLDEIDNRVKDFIESGNENKLRYVVLYVADNMKYDYLYQVIEHYENALTKYTGSNEVVYRLAPPIESKQTKKSKTKKTAPK